MLTLKKVNKAIKDKGYDAELVKGDGYFYFSGEDVSLCFEQGVYVYRLNQLTLEHWNNGLVNLKIGLNNYALGLW